MTLHSNPPHLLRYGIPVVAVGIALLVRLQLAEPLVPDVSFLLFAIAITVCALLYGRQSGFAATVVATLVIEFFLIPPVQSLAILGTDELLKLLLFVVEGVLISLLAGGFHTARQVGEQTQQELESLFTNAPVGIAFFDRQTRFVRINEPIARMNGIAMEDHIGRPIGELLPDNARTIVPVIEQVFETAQAVTDLEVVGQTPASPGFQRSWLTSFYPVPAKDGSVAMVGVMVMEITERRLVEEALRESEERFRVALKNSPIIVYRNDAELRYTWLHNPRNNVDQNQIIGRRDDEILQPDRAREIMRIKQQVLDTGVGVRTDFWLDEQDGDRRFYDITIEPLREASGEISGLTVAVMDITSIRTAEQALRESERRFRSTFENAAIGIAHVGLDGRWLRVNQKLCDIVGYSLEQMLELSFQDITHPDDLGKGVTALEQLISGEVSSYQAEKRYFHRNGRVIWVNLSTVLEHDGDGKPLYCISMIQDITLRKQTEQALRDADAAKNQFLAMLGHELRNPIAPISNALFILRSGDTDPDDVRELYSIMDRQLRHLTRLVGDLLEVSRITRGKIQLRRTIVDLMPIVRNAAESSRGLIDQQNHRLRLEIPEAPALIDADATRIEQAITNLLNNAAKYTEPGGEISLTVRLDDQQAEIEITDSGVGIDAETLPGVFDLFTQSPRSLDRSQGGLGIGLALVRSLVEMHGGRVEAHSEGIGRGSTFKILLPLAEAGTMPEVLDEPSVPSALDATAVLRRILVVDDNADSAETIARRLEMLGHSVWQAHDGHSALELARRKMPDVVLLDIGLPGIDGYQVARMLRTETTFSNALLIAVTGYGQQDDRRRSEEAGFNHHLVKPIDLDELAWLVGKEKGGGRRAEGEGGEN